MHSFSDDRLWRSVKPVLSTEKDHKGRIKGLGTAFVCGKEGSKYYLLTCWHVVETIGPDCLSVMGCKANVVAHGDKALDLALLEVDAACKSDLWAETEILALATGGEAGQPFHTIGHFWADEKEQDVTDSRQLNGELGNIRRKGSSRYRNVSGWEFKITITEDIFDRIRAGYSGAPVLDPASGLVIAVISHQQGDQYGHAIDVSNLMEIYDNADAFFEPLKGGEYGGSVPWIVKTLDHVRQTPPMRGWLQDSKKPVVALVEGHVEDLPKYLADDVFLDPWPALEDIPQEATTLNSLRFGEDENAFWKAAYHAIPTSLQASEHEQVREAVRAWLRGRKQHLFYLSIDIMQYGWRLPRLANAAQAFLTELAHRDPSMRLLVLIVCQPQQDRFPWWWRLWRHYRLERMAGVHWLMPLQPLVRTDVSGWCEGFSGDAQSKFSCENLLNALLDLFEDKPTGIRYRQVCKCLIDDGVLEKARVS